MKTFNIQTLGCKVNQYESEQVCALLAARGLRQTTVDQAELRIVNSCSVTVQAASQSRQAVRRVARLPLPVLPPAKPANAPALIGNHPSAAATGAAATGNPCVSGTNRAKVVVIGCWATSDQPEAASLAGVDAVLTHQDNLAAELDRLLSQWQPSSQAKATAATASVDAHTGAAVSPPGSTDDGWMMQAGIVAGNRTFGNKAKSLEKVNEIPLATHGGIARGGSPVGAASLPLLDGRQSQRQRAFLKVQDGCDAHCTYCIIPRLRPRLWSKPIEDAVAEARRLVESGHVELVLTGIFLGAYGQPTALRRRQPGGQSAPPLARLVDALCNNVPGLRRLRLSSLEPGDLAEDLLASLASHPQVVPHFHLPLQSGSDEMLWRMNRQYCRDDFLRMVDRVRRTFDRAALTTDIIVGFPGETDDEFRRTVEVLEHCRFIHVHAFPYSPRPGTAAARWTGKFVRGPVVNHRIDTLNRLANEFDFVFRKAFIGELVELIVERGEVRLGGRPLHHGRCERYFSVLFDGPLARPGDVVQVRIERVTPAETLGAVERV